MVQTADGLGRSISKFLVDVASATSFRLNQLLKQATLEHCFISPEVSRSILMKQPLIKQERSLVAA
jgi:hypothetical protein